MRFSEMKTAFMSVMDELKVSATLFDFAESIDAAQMFLLANLPADTISSLISVYSTDANDLTPRQVTLPGDYFKVEAVRIAKTRTTEGIPIYIPATVVPQRDFLNKSMYSSEPVVSFFNGKMNFNPDVAAAEDGYPGSIELSYRRIPNTYIMKQNLYSKGAPFTGLNQDPANAKLLTTQTLNHPWSFYGLSTSKLVGGTAVLYIAPYVVIAEIDYSWDDDSGNFSGIHVEDSTYIGLLLGNIVPSAFVSEKPLMYTGSTTLFRGDSTLPDFPIAFHQMIVDYAIGTFLLSRKPEIGNAYLNLIIQTFKSLGASQKINFGGEE